MNSKLATKHCSVDYLAAGFLEVTGKKAASKPLPLNQFFKVMETGAMKMDAQIRPTDTSDRYAQKNWMTGYLKSPECQWREQRSCSCGL